MDVCQACKGFKSASQSDKAIGTGLVRHATLTSSWNWDRKVSLAGVVFSLFYSYMYLVLTESSLNETLVLHFSISDSAIKWLIEMI